MGAGQLKGPESDAIFAVLCDCDQKIRIILRQLRDILRQINVPINQTCSIVYTEMASSRREKGKKLAT